MTIPTTWINRVGQWQGVNRLWLAPAEPAQESDSTAVLQMAAGGQFATLAYTWVYQGQPQEGLLLLGQVHQQQVEVVWIDSWHMQDKMMLCVGQVEADGAVWVKGSYAAPPDPDWGWRIALQPISPDQFRLVMHNITPAGEEMKAVEVTYARRFIQAESD